MLRPRPLPSVLAQEFVAPTNVYVVVGGQKFNIDLTAMPVRARMRPPALVLPCPLSHPRTGLPGCHLR